MSSNIEQKVLVIDRLRYSAKIDRIAFQNGDRNSLFGKEISRGQAAGPPPIQITEGLNSAPCILEIPDKFKMARTEADIECEIPVRDERIESHQADGQKMGGEFPRHRMSLRQH